MRGKRGNGVTESVLFFAFDFSSGVTVILGFPTGTKLRRTSD